MHPENLDHMLILHLLLKTQLLFPSVIGEVVDVIALSRISRLNLLCSVLSKKPLVYFYVLSMFIEDEPER
jgi:hypothetical protein